MFEEAVARWEALGRAGITVSVCCGPSGVAETFRWSVMLAHGAIESERPFAAFGFAHAVEIAEQEARQRGWLRDDV